MKKYTTEDKIACMIYLNEILPASREEARWYRNAVMNKGDKDVEELILNRLDNLMIEES